MLAERTERKTQVLVGRVGEVATCVLRDRERHLIWRTDGSSRAGPPIVPISNFHGEEVSSVRVEGPARVWFERALRES